MLYFPHIRMTIMEPANLVSLSDKQLVDSCRPRGDEDQKPDSAEQASAGQDSYALLSTHGGRSRNLQRSLQDAGPVRSGDDDSS